MLTTIVLSGLGLATIAGALRWSVKTRSARQPDPARHSGNRAAVRLLESGAALRSSSEIGSQPVRHGRRQGAWQAGPNIGQPSRVSVVIPAFNEEESIDWVLAHMPAWVSEIVLVDGLSTDWTEAVARRMCPDIVVVHQHERGKGAALRAGFAAASGDIVAMMDADGSTDPWELGRFVDALLAGADFVKGSRTLKGGGSVDFTLLRRAGNRGFVLLSNLLYGSEFTDLCYGYCAFWRHHLDALALRADGFEIETELVLNAVKAGLTIREVPSLELPRRGGSSNLSAFRDGRRVLKTIIRARAVHEACAPPAQIELVEHYKPSHHLEAWMPAGQDRRRGERRKLGRAPSRYSGPERRRADRRKPPADTTTIYVASSAW